LGEQVMIVLLVPGIGKESLMFGSTVNGYWHLLVAYVVRIYNATWSPDCDKIIQQ